MAIKVKHEMNAAPAAAATLAAGRARRSMETARMFAAGSGSGGRGGGTTGAHASAISPGGIQAHVAAAHAPGVTDWEGTRKENAAQEAARALLSRQNNDAAMARVNQQHANQRNLNEQQAKLARERELQHMVDMAPPRAKPLTPIAVQAPVPNAPANAQDAKWRPLPNGYQYLTSDLKTVRGVYKDDDVYESGGLKVYGPRLGDVYDDGSFSTELHDDPYKTYINTTFSADSGWKPIWEAPDAESFGLPILADGYDFRDDPSLKGKKLIIGPDGKQVGFVNPNENPYVWNEKEQRWMKVAPDQWKNQPWIRQPKEPEPPAGQETSTATASASGNLRQMYEKLRGVLAPDTSTVVQKNGGTIQDQFNKTMSIVQDVLRGIKSGAPLENLKENGGGTLDSLLDAIKGPGTPAPAPQPPPVPATTNPAPRQASWLPSLETFPVSGGGGYVAQAYTDTMGDVVRQFLMNA